MLDEGSLHMFIQIKLDVIIEIFFGPLFMVCGLNMNFQTIRTSAEKMLWGRRSAVHWGFKVLGLRTRDLQLDWYVTHLCARVDDLWLERSPTVSQQTVTGWCSSARDDELVSYSSNAYSFVGFNVQQGQKPGVVASGASDKPCSKNL